MKAATFLFLLFAILSYHEIKGQTKNTLITGVIQTEQGEKVSHATVYISHVNQKNRVLASGQSNTKGEFSISLSASNDSIALHVTGINIEPVTLVCVNRSQKMDVKVKERVKQMKDIVVKASRIYANGDTINYSVAAFQQDKDQSIGQVLKRLPGISVSDIGQISYKGIPIKNFYIEGLDLMKGRYGIATNNIDPNSISTIQVLENHQDIKALKDLKPEERASINLKLRNGIKGIFNLIATLGGGYGNKTLWSNELIATYFKRTRQLLATYKGNNTGTDLETELRSFDENGTSYKTTALSEITLPGAPGVDKRYYYVNRSHVATINHVRRIGENGELGTNISFLTDEDKRENQTSTIIYLPNREQNIVNEYMEGKRHKTVGYGNITYMLNNSRTYLKEQLKTELALTSGYSNMNIGHAIRQSGKQKHYSLQNTLHFTRRTNSDHGFELSSKASIEKLPHHLSVSDNLFSELLSGDNMYQKVTRSNLSMENKLGLLSAWVWGRLSIHPFGQFNFSNDHLNSTLQSYQNNISMNTLKAGIGVTAYYKLGKTYFNLDVVGGYRSYGLKDHLSGVDDRKQMFVVEPNLSARYTINGFHELKLHCGTAYSNPSIETLYGNYILTHYRQLSVYETHELSQAQISSAGMSYNYKNILSMWFANFDVGWVHYRPDVLYGITYDGVSERINSQPTHDVSNTYSVTLRCSKGFDWKKTKISLETGWKYYDSPLLLQKQIFRYSGKTLSSSLSFNSSPFALLSVDYSGGVYVSKMGMQSGQSVPTVKTLRNNLSLDFVLPAGINLGIKATHYYNNLNEGNKSFLLGNMELSYAIKRWYLTFSAVNLFNRKNYINAMTSELREQTTLYHLRPRALMLYIRYRIL